MRNGQFKSQKPTSYGVEENQLCVADMVQYLVRLAKLYEGDKTGNTELSEGLRTVAQALRPYADCLVIELTDAIKRQAPSTAGLKRASTKAKSQLPPALEAIGQEAIERILGDESYTKQQIAELGYRRFGISRSKLERLRKKDAQDSVRAALEHEESLDVISKEARRVGKERLA